VEFFYVNSLTLKKPTDIYRLIYCHLWQGSTEAKKKGSKSSDVERLLAKTKNNHIMVIDEVDFLLTSDEEIFYNLFEWTSQVTTRLGLIIISNTFDFPERLSTKVNSRMGDFKMSFKPYTQEEIREVVADRLDNCPYFSSGAVLYASKKLAKYSSDIRVILNILHEAVIEHKEENRSGQIEVKQIAKLWD
jgi:origin recognition complex subunit 1